MKVTRLARNVRIPGEKIVKNVLLPQSSVMAFGLFGMKQTIVPGSDKMLSQTIA